MAISDRIQSMYEHVEDIYDSVELTGVDTTDIDKNLVNVPNTLKEGYIDIINNGTDTLYNNFPKVSGEGTSLTLNNTYQAPMRNNLKGNTYQTKYSGKNLLPPTIATETKNGITLTNNGDGSYTLTGTYSSSTEFSIDLPTTLNGTYSFSGNNPTAGKNIQFRILKSSGSPWSTYLNNVNSTSENQSITNGTKQGIRIVGSFTSGFTLKPQLESGSTATSYEPYVGGVATPNPTNPTPVNVVSGDNEIQVCGKNLFDVTSFENQLVSGKILNDSGNEISDASSTYSKYKVFLKANTEYRLAGWWQRIYYYDTNGIFKSRSASISGGVNRSYTPTVDEYIGFQIYNSQWSEYKGQEQIEIGSSASTYEPYNGDTYNIDLPVENVLNLGNVSGTSNQVQYSINSNGELVLNGTCNSDRVTIDLPTQQVIKGKYTFSTNYLKATALKNGNGDNLFLTTSSNGVKTETINDTITQLVIYGLTGVSFNNQVIKLMVELGSKANSFTPYGTTPIELAEISTYNDEIFRTSGKNLYNKDTDDVGHVYSDTGNYGVVAVWTTSDWISVEPNERYHLSFSTTGTANIFFSEFDSSKTFIQRTTTSDFTPTNNTKYVRISFKNDLGTYDLQFEKGSSATEYNPYGTGEWYYKEAIKKVVLNGTETISAFDATSLSGSYQATFGITTRATTTDKVAISDKFIGALLSDRTTKTNIVYSYSDGYLRIATNVANTMAGFKTWLGTNNPKVLLEAATPTYNKITYEPLLEQLEAFYRAKSQEGQTNISQINNDLGFIISASALKKGDTIENNSASLLMSFGGLPNTNGEEETPDFEEDVSDVEEETPIEESIEEEIDEEPVEEEIEIEEEGE